MTFESLKDGAECECNSKANPDGTSTFICTIGGTSPKERDFLSKWERYKKAEKELPFEDCVDLCSLKGTSMNKIDGYDEAEIVELFKQRARFSMKSKTFIFKFNLGQSVGVVEHTPNVDHHSHHDLYKCDTFCAAFDANEFKNSSVTKVNLEVDAA